MSPQGSRFSSRTTGLRLVDSAVLVVALGIALLPLLPVYGGTAAVPAICGGLVLGAAAAAIPAWRGQSNLVTIAAALVAYFLFGGVLAAPDTTVSGFVPTAETIRALAVGIVTSWKQMLTVAAPLGTAGSFLVAPLLLALVGGALAVGLSWRVRRAGLAVCAAIVPFVVLGASMVLSTKESVAPAVAGTALAALLVVWASWRTGRLQLKRYVVLALTAAVVVAGGVVAGPLVVEGQQRFVLRDEIEPPFDLRDYPSPLSAFRQFVKADLDTDLLTVKGLPDGAFVRLATMDDFDGVVWNVAGDSGVSGSGEFRRVGSSIPAAVRGDAADVEIKVLGLSGVWLPTVGQPTGFGFESGDVNALGSDLRFNDATGTAVLPEGLTNGLAYKLSLVWSPVPEPESMGSAAAGAVALPVPVSVPESVDSAAALVAGDATSSALIADALASSLHDDGFFSHGIAEAGDYPSLSGHGADRVNALLTDPVMVGDGEQYASAMALMARSMGLPSRVVMGFLPNDDQSGKESITFTGKDISAWVEINFAGYGWVPFFPTPPVTQTPQESQPDTEPKPRPQVIQPPPQMEDPPAPPDEDTEQANATANDVPIPVEQDWTPIIVVSASIVIPLLVICVPIFLIIAAKSRRRRRRAKSPDPVTRVSGGWREVLDRARDLKLETSLATTRLEKAKELSEAFPDGDLEPAMLGLARGADAAVFGMGVPSDSETTAYWASVQEVVSAMGSEVSFGKRVRAALSLTSLRAARAERKESRRARAESARAARAGSELGPVTGPTSTDYSQVASGTAVPSPRRMSPHA